MRRHRSKEITTGLLLVVGAALLLATQLGFNLTLGQFTWFQILLLVGCAWMAITGLFSKDFYRVLFAGGIGYVVADDVMGWPHVNFWVMMLALGIAACGFSMIFRRNRMKVHFETDGGKTFDWDSKGEGVNFREVNSDEQPRQGEDNHSRRSGQDTIFAHKTLYTGSAEFIDGDCIFSTVNKYIEGQNVKDITSDIVFSTVRLYFDKASLSGGYAEVRTDVVFSNLIVYVPRNWNVIDQTGKVFGRHAEYRDVVVEGQPTLYIKGDCVFGGITVRKI